MQTDDKCPQRKPVMLEWSSPHNWCDRRCERCELAESCALQSRERERRIQHAAAGRDADDASVWIADVQADLEEALGILADEACAQGLDPDELASSAPPPPHPWAERLRRAGHELAVAAGAVGGEAQHVALILGGKCARLGTWELEDDDPDEQLFALDAVPNLLLIEALDAELGASLEQSGAAPAALARTRERHGEVRRALAPLLSRVPPEARVALAALVRARRAPSPFCTVR